MASAPRSVRGRPTAESSPTELGKHTDADPHLTNSVACSSKENKENQQTSPKVFGISSLLERILDFGLYINDSQEQCRKDLFNFRQVSKCWRAAVSKVLEAHGDPLYTVTMTATNSLNGTPEVDSNGKALDRFVRFLNTRQPQTFADFRLTMRKEVFCRETYDHLLESLEKCSNLLVELELKVPREGASLLGVFPTTLELSALRKLRVRPDEGEDLPEAPSANITILLMSIFLASSNLQVLEVFGISPEFQFVRLPSSLTTFFLVCIDVGPQLLDCLARNRLPELKKLTIGFWNVSKRPFPEGLMFRIFQNLRKSLRILKIHDPTSRYLGNSHRFPMNLRFPVMEKLKTLVFSGISCELESVMPSLNALFPSLKFLCLDDQTQDIMQKWTSGLPALPVSKLELKLVDDRKIDREVGYVLPIPVELLRSFRLTFPHITELKISHSGTQFFDLQLLFREMRQLERLSITVMPAESAVTSDHWDAVLIGVPLELVMGLVACPRTVWKSVKLMEIQNLPSIKMLSELSYFQLNDKLGLPPNEPLISDLAFIHAFNGMTKLEHVKLSGRRTEQRVSSEIVEEWMHQGRKIEYDNRE